jgi:hypothetical protein
MPWGANETCVLRTPIAQRRAGNVSSYIVVVENGSVFADAYRVARPSAIENATGSVCTIFYIQVI